MQSPPGAHSASPTSEAPSRPMRLVLGIAVVTLLIFLAVIGGSAEHSTGTAELRRGPASIVVSVLITLALLAGVFSLALLFWGLVTRHRRSLDTSAPQRHSPILVAGALLAIFAGLAALLALAARGRRSPPVAGLGAARFSHVASAGKGLPFNAVASFATSGVVIGAVAVVMVLSLLRSVGWRRSLRRLHVLSPDEQTRADELHAEGPPLEALNAELTALSVADPGTEPDPRRAVIGCYLQMLEIAARHGPQRASSETPTEYLRRMLAMTGAGRAPATSLTGLFERARYSERPVGESMRSDAISALQALRDDLLAGAVA